MNTTNNLEYVKSNIEIKLEYHCQFIPKITFVIGRKFTIFSSQLEWAFLFTFCAAFVFLFLWFFFWKPFHIFFTFQGLLTFFTFLGLNLRKLDTKQYYIGGYNLKTEGPQSFKGDNLELLKFLWGIFNLTRIVETSMEVIPSSVDSRMFNSWFLE